MFVIPKNRDKSGEGVTVTVGKAHLYNTGILKKVIYFPCFHFVQIRKTSKWGSVGNLACNT